MVQKRETKAIYKLCVREILSLSFVCGAYFFQFRGRNLVCFVIAYNFNGKYAPEAGKTRMRTAFFTRALRRLVRFFLACTDWALIPHLVFKRSYCKVALKTSEKLTEAGVKNSITNSTPRWVRNLGLRHDKQHSLLESSLFEEKRTSLAVDKIVVLSTESQKL